MIDISTQLGEIEKRKEGTRVYTAIEESLVALYKEYYNKKVDFDETYFYDQIGKMRTSLHAKDIKDGVYELLKRMANSVEEIDIEQELNYIYYGVYGKDIRMPIHDALLKLSNVGVSNYEPLKVLLGGLPHDALVPNPQYAGNALYPLIYLDNSNFHKMHVKIRCSLGLGTENTDTTYNEYSSGGPALTPSYGYSIYTTAIYPPLNPSTNRPWDGSSYPSAATLHFILSDYTSRSNVYSQMIKIKEEFDMEFLIDEENVSCGINGILTQISGYKRIDPASYSWINLVNQVSPGSGQWPNNPHPNRLGCIEIHGYTVTIDGEIKRYSPAICNTIVNDNPSTPEPIIMNGFKLDSSNEDEFICSFGKIVNGKTTKVLTLDDLRFYQSPFESIPLD